MKKLVFLGTVAVLAMCLAGQVQRQAVQTPLTTAMRAVANAEDAKKEFLNQYNQLAGSDARTLLVLYPWLAPTNLLSLIYSPAAETATTGGITAPTRSPAVIDRLTITKLKVSPMSLFLRAEWPLDRPILPYDWVYLMGKKDLLEEDWQTVAFMDVIPQQGWAEQEFQLDGLMWDDWENTDIPTAAFFKLEIPEADEWWWNDEEEEELYDPPDDPPPLTEQPPRSLFTLHNDAVDPSMLSETVPAIPGMHYLIVVGCWDPEVQGLSHTPPKVHGNALFSWTIAAPGSEPMTGSTDSHALGALYLETGRSWQHQDFWVVTIPTNATRGNIQVAATIVPDTSSIYGLPKRTYIDVVPLELEQRNMPKAVLQAPPGSTDNAGYRPAWITEGKTAYITGQPQPPALWARWCLEDRYDHGEAVSVAWRMTVETERPDYRNNDNGTIKLDDRKYPTNGQYTAYFNYLNLTPISVSDLMENEIVGGKCTIHYKIKNNKGKEEEHSFKFKIRGMNPKDDDVVQYANQVMPAFCKAQALAILRHESYEPKTRHGYNQFNTVEDKTLKWQPNKTSDTKDEDGKPVKQYGWGIGQVDCGPPTNMAYIVTTAQVWDWCENLRAAAKKFLTKLTEYEKMRDEIKRNYPQAPPLPTNTTKYGVNWTTDQWAVTVLYQGGKGVRTTTVWRKGEPVHLKCPLRFDPKANKWTFEDNGEKYAQQIAKVLLGNVKPVVE